MSEGFEVLAEWIVRKLRLPETIPAEERREILGLSYYVNFFKTKM